MIRLTRSQSTFKDKTTGEERTFTDMNVYVNPAYIKRVSRNFMGATVVEIDGCRYDTWCVETPKEVYDMANGVIPE